MPGTNGNKNAVGNKGGRPAKFKTPEEMQKLIDSYFNGGANKRHVVTMSGVVKVPILTITGLVYHLGFSSRDSFYEYEKNAEFTDTIKTARLRIEMSYEEQLSDKNCTGSIFALKNLGWEDKTKTELSGGLNLTADKIKLEIEKRKRALND